MRQEIHLQNLRAVLLWLHMYLAAKEIEENISTLFGIPIHGNNTSQLTRSKAILA